MTAAILFLTAFAAGVTGAWSPCGLSMVETLGSAGPRVGWRAVRISSATFALGALVGGAITFTALSALGSLLGGGGHGLALGAAIAIALLAALGEGLGVRVVPQIRRQVPEPWRRVLPLPLAAGLYGVLLGLGFTTFVLTLAVWALAGISVAIGSPLAGLLIGLGFGLGRALPVVVLAPRYETLGERLEVRMAEEPLLLRRLRLLDGALLAALAVVLLTAGTALAAAPRSLQGTDPSFAAGALAWQQDAGIAAIAVGDGVAQAQAQNVALGGPYLAIRLGDQLTVTVRASGAPVGSVAVQRTTQLAVSRGWLVWRVARVGGGDRLYGAPLPALAPVRLLAGAGRHDRVGRPALAGDHLAYAVTTPTGSRIVVQDLAHGTVRIALRSAALTQLSQPALHGGKLLYVASTYCDQRLLLVDSDGGGPHRALLQLGTTAQRDSGHDPGYSYVGSASSFCPAGTPPRTDAVLWTTALTAKLAYVTLLHPRAQGRPRARIVQVRR